MREYVALLALRWLSARWGGPRLVGPGGAVGKLEQKVP